MDMAERSFVPDGIPETEASNRLLRLVLLPDAALEDCILMQLPVVAFELPHGMPFLAGGGIGVSCDATGIHSVRFLQSVSYPRVLRDVSECHGHALLAVFCTEPSQELPAHGRHQCLCLISLRLPEVRLNLSLVEEAVACGAERDEILRPVRAAIDAPCLMVHLKHRILARSSAETAFVTIPVQDVFPRVPESHLLTHLVLFSPDFRIPHLLDIEGSSLYDDF